MSDIIDACCEARVRGGPFPEARVADAISRARGNERILVRVFANAMRDKYDGLGADVVRAVGENLYRAFQNIWDTHLSQLLAAGPSDCGGEKGT